MTKHPTRSLLLASATGAAMIASLTGAAHAQSQSGAAPSNQISEVVVTAERRSEKLQDVPLAVTSINAQSLLGANKVSLQDYYRSVPGLTLYDNGEGFKQLVIRGITTGNGNTPTVGIYVDDTPIGSSTAAARGDVLVPDIDPSDLARVEVLKGPQGTLYGASNMGGVLRYITVQPDTNNYSGRVEVDGSAVDHGGEGWGARAAVNVPLISDKLALRISGSDREDPGYIDDVANGSKDVNRSYVANGRLALLFTPNDKVTVKLNALIQERDGLGSSREDYNEATGKLVYGDLKSDRAPGEYDKERQQIYNATVDVKLGWATMTSSTSFAVSKYNSVSDLTTLFAPAFGYVYEDYFGAENYGVNLQQRFSTNKLTQEVKLGGQVADTIDWQTGIFYTHETSDFYQKFNSISTVSGAIQSFNDYLPIGDSIGYSHYDEIAAYGDVTYHFTPKFSFQAGVRYSYNYQYNYNYSDGGLLGDASTGLGKSDEGVPTFVVAPEYKLTNDVTLYGRIASGYRAGGPNFTIGGTNEGTYKSDSTVNYEVGTKSFFLDHKAYVELSGFYIVWSNIQLLGTNADDEEFFSNGGGAVSRGFEYSGQYHPFSGLTLTSNFTYDDAHLTDPAPSGIAGAVGDRLPYAPRVAGQVGANYKFPLFGEWSGLVGGDWSYVGDRESDFQSDFSIPRVRLPSYSVTDLEAGVDNGRYSATVFVKNLFDKRGFAAANAETLAKTTTYAIAVIQPLTVGFSLAAKF